MPPELRAEKATASSCGSFGLAACATTSSWRMPRDEGLNETPPLLLCATPKEVAPSRTRAELPGAKARALTVCPALPDTPNDHVLPPSLERNTPAPPVATRMTARLLGSTARALPTRLGQADVDR